MDNKKKIARQKATQKVREMLGEVGSNDLLSELEAKSKLLTKKDTDGISDFIRDSGVKAVAKKLSVNGDNPDAARADEKQDEALLDKRDTDGIADFIRDSGIKSVAKKLSINGDNEQPEGEVRVKMGPISEVARRKMGEPDDVELKIGPATEMSRKTKSGVEVEMGKPTEIGRKTRSGVEVKMGPVTEVSRKPSTSAASKVEEQPLIKGTKQFLSELGIDHSELTESDLAEISSFIRNFNK